MNVIWGVVGGLIGGGFVYGAVLVGRRADTGRWTWRFWRRDG